MKKLPYLIAALFLFTSLGAPAQKMERRNVRKGNKLYEEKKYTKAEIQYRKALEVNPHSTFATYNLGNALYKQNKGQEALQQYQMSVSREHNPRNKAAILHNAGNVFMGGKDYEKAVESYKTSLKLNPNDNETRYNLALAQTLLKKQQNDKKKNKDNQKDKQNQQKQQQQQQQQDQKNKQNQQHKQQQQQGQEQVSKEKAQQMLDALSQDEKETQDKVKKLQVQRSKAKKTDKDW